MIKKGYRVLETISTVNGTLYKDDLVDFENIESNGPSKVLRYFDVKGDKVPFCHDHWPIFNNKKVGEITSGIFSTEFNTNVAIGIVDVEYAIEGTKLQVLIDNKLRDAFVKERPFNPKLKPFI